MSLVVPSENLDGTGGSPSAGRRATGELIPTPPHRPSPKPRECRCVCPAHGDAGAGPAFFPALFSLNVPLATNQKRGVRLKRVGVPALRFVLYTCHKKEWFFRPGRTSPMNFLPKKVPHVYMGVVAAHRTSAALFQDGFKGIRLIKEHLEPLNPLPKLNLSIYLSIIFPF